jgi:hypothetical protein
VGSETAATPSASPPKFLNIQEVASTSIPLGMAHRKGESSTAIRNAHIKYSDRGSLPFHLYSLLRIIGPTDNHSRSIPALQLLNLSNSLLVLLELHSGSVYILDGKPCFLLPSQLFAKAG